MLTLKAPAQSPIDERIPANHLVHPGWLIAEPRLVDESEEQAVADSVRFAAFAQLMRTAGAMDRAATDILASLGVTAGAFFALLELESVGDQGIAPSELARRLAVARRTATLYVDILVKHGWVSREAHPEDKRMILARLTDAGRDVVEHTAREYRSQLANLLVTLNLGQAIRLNELLAGIPLEADTLTCGFLQVDPDDIY